MTLRSAQKARVLVSISRTSTDDENNCVVLDVNSDYFLVADVIHGFRFDGFSVFRTGDVTKVQHNKYDKFRTKIMEKEGRYPPQIDGGIPPVKDLKSVFQYLERTSTFCIIMREADREWWSNHCAIEGVKGDTVRTIGFTGDGAWEKRTRILHFDEISRVRFSSDYLRQYERHAHGRQHGA